MAQQPQPGRRSPLQYARLVRDVLLTSGSGVLLARRAETPEAVPMGRDERAVQDGYAYQDPVEVAEELTVAARLFVNTLGGSTLLTGNAASSTPVRNTASGPCPGLLTLIGIECPG